MKPELLANVNDTTVPVGSGDLLCRRLGMAVKRRRIANGETLPAVAKAAGISKGCLSKIENHGANITLETLVRLCDALNMTPSGLLALAA